MSEKHETKAGIDRSEGLIRIMAAYIAAGRNDYEAMARDAVAAVDALEEANDADHSKPAKKKAHEDK